MNSLSLPCYRPLPSLTSLRKKKKRKNYVTRTKHLKNKTRQHLLNKFILCWHMVFVSVLISFPLIGRAVEDSNANTFWANANTTNTALLRRGVLKKTVHCYKVLVGRVVVQFVEARPVSRDSCQDELPLGNQNYIYAKALNTITVCEKYSCSQDGHCYPVTPYINCRSHFFQLARFQFAVQFLACL